MALSQATSDRFNQLYSTTTNGDGGGGEGLGNHGGQKKNLSLVFTFFFFFFFFCTANPPYFCTICATSLHHYSCIADYQLYSLLSSQNARPRFVSRNWMLTTKPSMLAFTQLRRLWWRLDKCRHWRIHSVALR
jgi:hypothetical protein